MESLNLSHVKATDRGISLLLHTPLTHLTNLTLSHQNHLYHTHCSTSRITSSGRAW
ncbi:hypothetical protein GBAR_LOCUS15422 [Geodia barretti]|uniref:Uncharacterized protein n=1 Tax=Geodia barretti TaxID=519541 RepID=A0AA35SC19_GEOBA|nr:hypothetical protein GBAR_LOCUS15422 [Geodia barretti]